MHPAQIDVIRRILELASSAREGLEYVDGRSREGDLAMAAQVLTDVIAAVAQIQEAFPVAGLADNDAVQAATLSLQDGFRQYLHSLEAQDQAALAEIPGSILLPRYIAWQEALEQALRPQ